MLVFHFLLGWVVQLHTPSLLESLERERKSIACGVYEVAGEVVSGPDTAAALAVEYIVGAGEIAALLSAVGTAVVLVDVGVVVVAGTKTHSSPVPGQDERYPR